MNQFPRPSNPYLLASILFLFLSILTCTEEEPELIDNFVPEFNDPVLAPIAIEFLQADASVHKNVDSITIILIDPADQVVTSNGLSFDTIHLDKGVLSLALRRNAIVAKNTPYRFHIRAIAKGYLSTIKTILISNRRPKYFPVYMANMDDPPIGMNVLKNTLNVNTDGIITDSIALTIDKGNGADGKMIVEIPQDTRLYSNGLPVEGPDLVGSATLGYVNPLIPVAGSTFPGFLVTDAIQNNEVIATPSEPIFFDVPGWYFIDLEVGNIKVDSFSQPVRIEYIVNPYVINTSSFEPYDKEDMLLLWSLNEENGFWIFEDTLTLNKNIRGLVAKFDINHLSAYAFTVVDVLENTCPDSSTIEINIFNPDPMPDPVPDLMPRRQYYCKLITAQNGIPFASSATEVGTVIDFINSETTTITIANSPSNQCLSFLIHEYPPKDGLMPGPLVPVSTNSAGSGSGGVEVFLSCYDEVADEPNPLCSAEAAPNLPPINMSFLEAGETSCITFHIEVRFGANSYPICNNTLWYKQCNVCSDSNAECLNSPYRFAGILEQGDLISPKFEINEIYCMRIWYGMIDEEGAVTEQKIDFVIDLGIDEGDTSIAEDNDYVEYARNSGDCGTGNHFDIVITDGQEVGLTAIVSCLEVQ